MSTKEADVDSTAAGQDYDYARYRHGHSIPEAGVDIDAEGRDTDIDRWAYDPIVPDGGLARDPGAGSLDRTDCFRDQFADSFSPGFASGVEPDVDTGFQPARTTFYAREAPENRQDRFDELWPIHHGIDGWPECPIDEVERGHRTDRAQRDARIACDAVAQAVGFPEHVRDRAIQRALTIDCRPFSRHYGGINGATIGLGLLMLFDSPSEAMVSPLWADIQAVCDGSDIDAEALAEYVFRNYSLGDGGA